MIVDLTKYVELARHFLFYFNTWFSLSLSEFAKFKRGNGYKLIHLKID